MTARFAGGSHARADVLVGADGIHSATRSALFPDEGPPRWSGAREKMTTTSAM
ncbi:hypothetical protein [Actinomadura sp. K4S16]|uniref:hypothetical protein n=1 Tax=Actinomadura sp. K4S16 TaxID=1316147 RepID=UPI00190F6CB8|nr:hypothetical protein [Actinomadura sp. K4S16]